MVAQRAKNRQIWSHCLQPRYILNGKKFLSARCKNGRQKWGNNLWKKLERSAIVNYFMNKIQAEKYFKDNLMWNVSILVGLSYVTAYLSTLEFSFKCTISQAICCCNACNLLQQWMLKQFYSWGLFSQAICCCNACDLLQQWMLKQFYSWGLFSQAIYC